VIDDGGAVCDVVGALDCRGQAGPVTVHHHGQIVGPCHLGFGDEALRVGQPAIASADMAGDVDPWHSQGTQRAGQGQRRAQAVAVHLEGSGDQDPVRSAGCGEEGVGGRGRLGQARAPGR